MMEGNNFLDRKYPDLTGSKPVEKAVQAAKVEKGKTSHGRQERIDTYLSRIESMIKDPRAFGLLKEKVLQRYVTKEEDIPESYWKLQEKIMRERGQGGDWTNATEEEKIELRRQNTEGVLADQRASLEQWVDYFNSPDSESIPIELKYWIFRSIISLQEYDKEKKEFPKRSKGTVKQFPDLNHEALGYMVNRLVEKYQGKKIEWEHDIQLAERAEFEAHLAKEDFAKLYAWSTELMNPIPEHLLPVTEGEWRKYQRDTEGTENYKALTESVRGRGTGWCTAGANTAKTQLQNGDFYCYYTLDDDKKPTIPRIAIRMEGNKIAEVRGIAHKQNLDPYMNDILSQKLEEFPDKEMYIKKDKDMKYLTQVEAKIKTRQELDRDDLIFIYELQQPIKGFGYQRDPRIDELVKTRSPEKDMPIVFDCSKEQIARNPDQVTKDTKAYVGKLFPGIFSSGIEHIYTSFPDGQIQQFDIKTGGKDQWELRQELLDKQYKISTEAENILQSEEFITSANIENMKLIRVTGQDLGITSSTSLKQIFEKAKEFGLELCPAEVGPYFRMLYLEKSATDIPTIAMEPIDVVGSPRIFSMHSWDRFKYLDARPYESGIGVHFLNYSFVFRLREASSG